MNASTLPQCVRAARAGSGAITEVPNTTAVFYARVPPVPLTALALRASARPPLATEGGTPVPMDPSCLLNLRAPSVKVDWS